VEVAGLTLGPVNRPVLLGIAAGGDHTCIIGSSGKIFCWGSNSAGQLGLNSQTDFDTMQPARTLTKPDGSMRLANLIAAGDKHTCAVYDPDIVACWGRNYSLLPVPVAGVAALRVAAGGDQTCVIGPGGIVKCWGGLLNFGPASNPSVIPSVSARGAIAVGRQHACALDLTGTIKCWGQNAFGQLGNGNKFASPTPVVVSTISTTPVVDLAAGERHTCALFSSGSVECWGMNDSGQTGDPSTTTSTTLRPVQVVASGAIAIALGAAHSCAVIADGNVRRMECWGSNGAGQLGDGSTSTFSLKPVRVTGLL
jgi:alpha-tubulin suppressor-like RCC1 family protein